MAYKRKRSYGKKRFVRRKRMYKKPMKKNFKKRTYDSTYVRGTDWMSNSLWNRMEYMSQIFFSSVASPTNYLYRGNSIYDPDQTGTGTQPLGYANMSAIYTNYECPSCFIRVEFINNTAVPCWIIVTPVITTSDVNTYNSAQGRPGAKIGYCQNNVGVQHVVVTNRSSTSLIRGVKMGETDNIAAVTTNPANQWYWNICIQPCDYASAISGVLNVKLIYKTRWTGRKVV